MSRILFSPIGGSDPIRNFRDGSMLHICRHYLPDKIYLYLSYEMYEHHKKDNRYLYCIKELEKKISHSFDVNFVIREDLKNVQNHEIFYNDFRNCIAKIREKMSSEDELYVNISSGTPAMKNALVVLSTVAEIPFVAVQVSTPLKRSNNTDENMDDYEVEAQWECNEDNKQGVESRCEIVKSANLATLLKVNIIKKHLLAYDYFAAYQIAEEMKEQLSPESLLYLKQAKARIELNTYLVNEIAKQTGYQPMPVRNENDRELVEYLLQIQIKKQRGNYDDFIRSITPAVFTLMKRALNRQCNIEIEDYCKKDKNKILRWDEKKLKQNTEIDTILNNAFRPFKYNAPVYSVHIKELIIACSANEKLNKTVEDLRSAEEDVRNTAAHTMKSITEDIIKRWTGFTSDEILNKMKELAKFTGCVKDDSVWNSYDLMNREIIKILDESITFDKNI